MIEFKYSPEANIDLDEQYLKMAKEEISSIQGVIKKWGYEDVRASLNLPFDESILRDSREMCEKLSEVDVLVVIWIWGSDLGTKAVYDAIKWKYANSLNEKKVYFIDTTDDELMGQFLQVLTNEIKAWKKLALNPISKSWSTAETIANTKVLLDFLKTNQSDWQNNVVITTWEWSKFWNYWKENNFHLLSLPDQVGWRYSVFSNVWIFPLMFAWVDCEALLKWACDALINGQEFDLNVNQSLKASLVIFTQHLTRTRIFDLFLFSCQFENVWKWYRQLMWESLWKEDDMDWKKVFTGITPSVSIGSTDLHSIAQLYLWWPQDKMVMFVTIKERVEKLMKSDKWLDDIVKNLDWKSLSQVMRTFSWGTMWAFGWKWIPFINVEFDAINEYNVWYFLQFNMIKMMILGKLFNVKWWDQPNVEEYKIISRKMLAGEINC